MHRVMSLAARTSTPTAVPPTHTPTPSPIPTDTPVPTITPTPGLPALPGILALTGYSGNGAFLVLINMQNLEWITATDDERINGSPVWSP